MLVSRKEAAKPREALWGSEAVEPWPGPTVQREEMKPGFICGVGAQGRTRRSQTTPTSNQAGRKKTRFTSEVNSEVKQESSQTLSTW